MPLARSTRGADATLACARRAAVAGCAAAAATVVWVPGARAAAASAPATATAGDLRDAVSRVVDAWRKAGGSVVVDRTRFILDDQTLVVTLPDLPDNECTTVALLGARSLGFHVSPAGATGADTDPRTQSEAGVVSMEQCGETPARRFVVASDSGRGALETVVARSSTPLPALQSVLPERTGGLGPFAEPGALATLPTPEKRAALAEARAKRDGASIGSRSTWRSGADGAGVGEQTLAPGCHAFQLFALDPGTIHPTRRGKLDLDAEMRDMVDDRVLARDRTDAPDAELPVCVGETTQVGIAFVGSPPGAPVLVSHVAWSLPEHLPTLWGAEARAHMAEALLARHVVSLPAEPIQLAQGGSGVTFVPFSIEPGGCYVAIVSLVQGVARAVGLRVRVAARDASDDRGPDATEALVGFCAGTRAFASAQIEAHGTPLLGWGLALYHVQTGVWDVPP